MIKTNRKIIFLILSITFHSLLFGVESSLIIDKYQSRYDIGNHIYCYRDIKKNLTIDDIISKEISDKFKVVETEDVSLGLRDVNVWCRINIVNKTSKPINILFRQKNPDINYLDFYLFKNRNIEQKIQTGEKLNFKTRESKFRDFVFSILLEPEAEYTLYIKGNNEGDVLYMKFEMVTFKNFSEEKSEENLISGIIIGLFVFIIISNLFLYISVNDRLYLYYSLYILFLTLFAFNIEGFGFKYLWPNIPWLNDRTTMIFLTTSVFFLYGFSKEFLQLSKNAPLLNKVFTVLQAIVFVFIIISFAGYPYLLISVDGFQLMNLITVLIILYASIIVLKRRYKPALYFIGAYLLISVGVVLYVLRSLGYIGENLFSINGFYLGLVGQSMLLSIAALDRFRRLSQEKNRKLEEQKKELVIQRDKAQEAERLKSAFLSNMSHEIRTPMNSVVGFSGLLNDPDLTEEQTKKFINLINANCRILLQMIDDIIDLAKIELGEIVIDKQEISVDKLLDELHGYFLEERNRLEKNHIEIYLIKATENANPTIIADSERLQQVFKNLMRNALKFTDEGYIEYGYRNEAQGCMVFYVRDTGIGLTEKQVEHIFDRFRKIEENRTKIYGGAGVGLNISKSLISLMNGKIWVESKEGEGTSFYFKFENHF